MNHKLPRPAIAVVVLVLIIAAYFVFKAFAGTANNQLTASGTIESVTINVAPELSGKVADVLTDEGQTVKTGDPLLHLDSSLLQAQKQQALAALDVTKSAAATADAALAAAQNQNDLALNTALVTDRSQRTSQWVNSAPSDFNLPLWYYSQAEQMTAAQTEVDAAQKALADAQNNLAGIQASAGSSDFVKGENNLAAAEAGYRVANDLNNRVQNGKNIDQLTRYELYQLSIQQNNPSKTNNPVNYLINSSNIDQNIKDYSQQLFDDAKSTLKDAQSVYDNALTTNGAKDVLKARANVSLQQERYNTAMDYVSFIRTGSMSPSASTAQNALNQAKAADDQAHNTIQQAQANVDLIDAQISKLTVYAPIDGVILTRNVEPGEFVQPGAIVLTLANLNQLTITVYVPENLYGQISLGQKARVTVDSFAGITFDATVIHISDQGEFTPRNVQTVEGRSSVMYAIKLQVDNPQGKLKPGMPADVAFGK